MTTPDDPFIPPPPGEPVPDVDHATDRGKPGELSPNQDPTPDTGTDLAVDDALVGIVLTRAQAAMAGAPTVDQFLALAAKQIKKNWGPAENINKFTEWYYGNRTSASWCYIGLSWVAAHAGTSQAAGLAIMGGKHAYVPDADNDKSRWHSTPQRGDFVALFGFEHIEVVEKVLSSTQIQTIGFNTTNGSSDDAVARKIRNRSDADGYYRPAYATTPSGDDDVPQYVSLGMSKPQAVKAGSVVDAKFDVEYGDAGDAHANGNYPGILSGAAKKTSFVATTEVPAGAVWRFVEVDPKNGYKVTKTYPTRTGPFTETGKVEPGKHLYVELHPTADGTVNVAVKVQYWDL